MQSPFVDISAYLDGDCELVKPTVAEVLPERCLFYAGAINEVHGEPSVGKTNILLAAAGAVLEKGGKVFYLDPEDSPARIIPRALSLGISREAFGFAIALQNLLFGLVQPFIGVTTSAVSDPYVATSLTINGLITGVDFARLVPQDSGQRVFRLVNLVRSWSVLNPDVTRFLALRFEGEGSLANEIRFFDRSAPPTLRPRLRITYMPRTEFSLP